MSAENYLPDVKITPLVYEFGEIDVNQSQSLVLTAQNMGHLEQLTITFRNTNAFKVEPDQGTIGAGALMEFRVIFCPKCIGIFSENLGFKIQGFFDGHVRTFGVARKLSEKPLKRWGPLSTNPEFVFLSMNKSLQRSTLKLQESTAFTEPAQLSK